MRKIRIGIIRPLDPDDPRNPEHPSHRAKWLVLAEELGRLMAAQEWERQHGTDKDKAKKGSK